MNEKKVIGIIIAVLAVILCVVLVINRKGNELTPEEKIQFANPIATKKTNGVFEILHSIRT